MAAEDDVRKASKQFYIGLRQAAFEHFDQRSGAIENAMVSFTKNPDDFIIINDSMENPLVFDNSYTKIVFSRNTGIRFEVNGCNMGYLILN